MTVQPEVIAAARAVEAESGVAAAALLAVALTESNAVPFTTVSGRWEPLIRFEGHYFDRLITEQERRVARKAGVSAPRAGAVRNPASQEGRWRLLDRACAISRDAAWCATSWGLGQVMGSHWQRLGFNSIGILVGTVRSTVEGQFRLVARFLDAGGLAGHLPHGDFAGFAKAYNGPNYRRNAYDAKIAAAFEKGQALLARP